MVGTPRRSRVWAGAVAAWALLLAVVGARVWTETFESMEAWTLSTAPEFTGEWTIGQGPLKYALVGDTALIAASQARRHAISTSLDEPVPVDGDDFIMQYTVRLHNHLECGGAYVKALSAPFDDAAAFNDKSPYSIMFGPDKCGTTDKVHFIFRHKSPKTGKYTEHHAASTPAIVNDRFTHLYTLAVWANQSYSIAIDGVVKSYGDLASTTDFKPPVQTPAEIDDPNDVKPSDWVDQAKIPDPNAVKPDDWDEDAPATIPDTDAVKPADWDESAPKQIPDPEAEQPDDWSVEDDGEWEPPLVDNPECSTKGCGPWSPPQKPNPAYKGKWKAPLIDNPEYKGPWKPRQVPNPDYFEVTKVTDGIAPVQGLGFEIWTMQDNIEFDDIYIGHSADEARAWADAHWKVKYEAEKAAHEEVAKEEKKVEDAKKAEQAGPLGEQVDKMVQAVQPYLDIVTANPYPFAATLLAGLLAFVAYMWKSGSAPAPEVVLNKAKLKRKDAGKDEQQKKETGEVQQDDESEGDEDEDDDEDEQ